MKSIKSLGLLAVAAAALMALAGTASATVTSPPGTPYGGEIVATSTNFELDGAIDIKCASSSIKATPISGGATSGIINSLSFTNCGNDTVTILKEGKPSTHGGTLSIASNGTVTWTGTEVTLQMHRIIFFVPLTTHCIYKTNNTFIGTLTENVAPAKLHIDNAEIPQIATDGACGDTATWTGAYTVSTPSSAIVID